MAGLSFEIDALGTISLVAVLIPFQRKTGVLAAIRINDPFISLAEDLSPSRLGP